MSSLKKATYCQQLDRKINGKLRRLMHKSMLEGEASAQSLAADYKNKLDQIRSLLHRKKVDNIIGRSEDLLARVFIDDAGVVVSMVHKLFRNVAAHTDVEITAHTDDIAQIKAGLSEHAQVFATRKTSFQEDDGFARGSMIIKANKSIVDAQVKTQLERARSLLLQHFEGKNG